MMSKRGNPSSSDDRGGKKNPPTLRYNMVRSGSLFPPREVGGAQANPSSSSQGETGRAQAGPRSSSLPRNSSRGATGRAQAGLAGPSQAAALVQGLQAVAAAGVQSLPGVAVQSLPDVAAAAVQGLPDVVMDRAPAGSRDKRVSLSPSPDPHRGRTPSPTPAPSIETILSDDENAPEHWEMKSQSSNEPEEDDDPMGSRPRGSKEPRKQISLRSRAGGPQGDEKHLAKDWKLQVFNTGGYAGSGVKASIRVENFAGSPAMILGITELCPDGGDVEVLLKAVDSNGNPLFKYAGKWDLGIFGRQPWVGGVPGGVHTR